VEHRVSEEYRKWEQRKPKIPEGLYFLRSFHAEKITYEFRGGKVKAPMTVLLLDTVYDGKNHTLPHFMPIADENHIGEKSFYYRAWTLAAGHRPERPRLKDMPLYVLEGKYFEGMVRFHKPLESDELSKDLYRYDELSEPLCICGRKESEHGKKDSECAEFRLQRMTVPEELWWSKVTKLVRRAKF